jgi:hypothetical protein
VKDIAHYCAFCAKRIVSSKYAEAKYVSGADAVLSSVRTMTLTTQLVL